MPTPRRIAFVVGTIAAAVLTAGCDPTSSHGVIYCTDELRPTLLVRVLDEEGRLNAAGAIATVSQDSFDASAEGLFDTDPIHVYGDNRGGTFALRVTKPWYVTALVEGVEVPAAECGVTQAPEVTVTLPLKRDAPAVRQVVLPSHGYAFGECGLSATVPASVATVPASVEADPSVSHELHWVSRDTLAATVDSGGRITAECHGDQSARTIHVVAMAVADTTVRDSVPVTSWGR